MSADDRRWEADGVSVRSILADHAGHFASLDLQLLIAHVVGRERSWVLAHPEATLMPQELAAFRSSLVRLESGEPLPYVLGHWEFFGLDFIVTPQVLIPRPETERLVEIALAWLKQTALASPTILDIGTGSGCVAVSMAVHCPGAQIIAADISSDALAVARRNAQKHHVAGRIQFVHADLLPPFIQPSSIHLLLANLPYIPTGTLQGLGVYGKEPTLALDGGPDGLTLIRRLLETAPPCLAAGGLTLLEIEASLGDAASRLARQHFPLAEIAILPDLAGRDRLLSISIPHPLSKNAPSSWSRPTLL